MKADRFNSAVSGRAKKRRKILFFVTEDWAFCLFRMPVALAAIERGDEVVVVTNVTRHAGEITGHNIKLVPIRLARSGMNLFSELKVLWRVIGILIKEKPDILHNVAIKPVLYGSIAARLTGVSRVINAVTGMGYLFTHDNIRVKCLRAVVQTAFRYLLKTKGFVVLVQNPDDLKEFTDNGMADRKSIHLIKGSGVDTTVFRATEANDKPRCRVILATRMLYDKGVAEFIEAAKRLGTAGLKADFILIGGGDPHNPTSISDSQLQAWHDEGTVTWLGRRNDMALQMQQADIVCLPSYREGLPKVLIEAASSARAIVTTDVPGCREIVRHGVNGLLVNPRDVQSLMEALRRLVLDKEERIRMGKAGRVMVEKEYSVDRVIRLTLGLYDLLLQETG